MRENLFSGVCKQQRRRPVCAFAQSEQRHFYSLFRKNHIENYFEWNLNCLGSLCSGGDWFGSHFVGNPKDNFCLDEAHMKYARAPE